MKTLKNIAAAFQFLTVIPLPVKTDGENLKHSIPWHPAAGALCGLVSCMVYFAGGFFLNDGFASVLAILTYIVMTRGLHLDGFMDTIDGFFSHRDRESMLRIMKDPTVGSFALLGCGVWFLAFYSQVRLLTPADFILIQVFSRLGTLLMPLLHSYPRESGTGKFFVENVTRSKFLGALILTFLIMTAVYCIPPLWQTYGDIYYFSKYGACLAVTFLTAYWVGRWSKKKIGGITGDVLGFTIETINLLLILVIVVLKENPEILRYFDFR